MVVADFKLFDKILVALNNYANSVMVSIDGETPNYKLIAFVPNESDTHYNMLISADWLNEYEEFDVIDDLLPFLRAEIKGEVFKVNTIAVIATSDPIITDLSAKYQHVSDELILNDVTLGSNHFNKLIISFLNN